MLGLILSFQLLSTIPGVPPTAHTSSISGPEQDKLNQQFMDSVSVMNVKEMSHESKSEPSRKSYMPSPLQALGLIAASVALSLPLIVQK